MHQKFENRAKSAVWKAPGRPPRTSVKALPEKEYFVEVSRFFEPENAISAGFGSIWGGLIQPAREA